MTEPWIVNALRSFVQLQESDAVLNCIRELVNSCAIDVPADELEEIASKFRELADRKRSGNGGR